MFVMQKALLVQFDFVLHFTGMVPSYVVLISFICDASGLLHTLFYMT